MNARFSVASIALMIFGIFMLVGFLPLGVLLIIMSMAVQSGHRQKVLAHQKGRRQALTDKRHVELQSAMRAMRS